MTSCPRGKLARDPRQPTGSTTLSPQLTKALPPSVGPAVWATPTNTHTNSKDTHTSHPSLIPRCHGEAKARPHFPSTSLALFKGFQPSPPERGGTTGCLCIHVQTPGLRLWPAASILTAEEGKCPKPQSAGPQCLTRASGHPYGEKENGTATSHYRETIIPNIMFLKRKNWPGMMAHTYNHSTLGSRGRSIT